MFGLVLGGKVLARAVSVYNGLCWVHNLVESRVVKIWLKRSVFTLGGVESWVVQFWQLRAGFIL